MSRLTLTALCGVALCGAAPAARAGTFKLLYSFQGGNDGIHPSGNLLNVGGTLYGTTEEGGASNDGTVFALDPSTGAETQLHVFTGSPNDGALPEGGLVAAGGVLYGTTYDGGANGDGTVFSLDLATGVETVLFSFDAKHGTNPESGLTQIGRKFYGTAAESGHGSGTVFAINPGTGATVVAHAFDGTDGAFPSGTLLAAGTEIYGTTISGGANSAGTVFSLDTATQAESVVYSFVGGADGSEPTTGVIKLNGVLYGTTLAGGGSSCNGSGCGTVFAVDPSNGAETTLHAFQNGKDGAAPSAGLLNVNGTLYGTTSQGGGTHCNSMGCGTVFVVNPKTGAEKIVHQFGTGSKGATPYGGLIEIGGTLYGTTGKGGAQGHGTVFSYTP